MSAALKLEQYYTYADYANGDTSDERYELIDGAPYAMASAGGNHQDIAFNLARKIADYLDDKRCVVRMDQDVRLNFNKADDTVVRPDVFVVCDPKKLADNKAIKGAPDMVVEVFSPSTKKYDMTTKLAKLKEAKVREIWLVDPVEDVVYTYVLDIKGEYIGNIYGDDAEIQVAIFPDLIIDAKDIFFQKNIQEED